MFDLEKLDRVQLVSKDGLTHSVILCNIQALFLLLYHYILVTSLFRINHVIITIGPSFRGTNNERLKSCTNSNPRSKEYHDLVYVFFKTTTICRHFFFTIKVFFSSLWSTSHKRCKRDRKEGIGLCLSLNMLLRGFWWF